VEIPPDPCAAKAVPPVRFTHTIGGKESVLAERDGASLFAAWTGQWYSDIFAVTEEDIARFVADRERERAESLVRARETRRARKAEKKRRGV